MAAVQQGDHQGGQGGEEDRQEEGGGEEAERQVLEERAKGELEKR